jgi:hypothetical protein
MLEAIIIIIALGGLEIALWWADHKRQAEQLATLEAIWVELALLNEERSPAYAGRVSEVSPVRPVDLPISVAQTSTAVTQ